ncbi:MAG: phage terminase large subunit family protein [Sulfuricaulis sp.]
MISQEARGVLLSDPALFISHYFPHRLRKLQDFHLRLIHNAVTERRGLILYPAQHGKTTLVSTLLPIWAMCKDPNIQMAVIAKNEQEATSIVLSIQSELCSNPGLMEDFGNFKPMPDEDKPWALQKMSIAQRRSNAKEPTIAAFGSGSRGVLGHRTHWTICDDVINEKNSATPEQRAKIKEWFMQSVRTMNLPQDDCRTTVVGTLFDPADLYSDLVDLINPETGDPIWVVQREDAIVDEERKKPLWPAQWPWRLLMELKAEMGTIDFNKRLRNIAVDKSRMVFKEEYVRGGYYNKQQYPGCLDKKLTVGWWDPSMKRVSGFDPAIGGGRQAKFCAHVTLGLGACDKHEKCVWVIDVVRDQMTLPQQCDLILAMHEKYELNRSMVEANSYQVGLYQELKRRMDEAGVAWNIEPHYTTRTNKPDPELGVQAMSPWFENGWVHIPWANPESQRRMRQFVDELIQYPGKTTDTVMAFWFAWKNLQEAAPRFKSSNYLRKPGSSWSALGARRRTIKNPYYTQRAA